MTVEEVRRHGETMKRILGLNGSPIGVRVVRKGEKEEPEVKSPSSGLHMRYCQALMMARHGEHVVITEKTIACPAAARAFGFRPLPEVLKSGKGLIGFGITAEEEVGKRMFEEMPVLEPGKVVQLDLFPLEQAQTIPDIVVVEDEVEKLMWIVLGYMHAKGGERVKGTTAVLQATCVDSTIIPLLEQRLNYGMGCYGCREATDISPHETVVGFPAAFLPAIVEHLEYLNQKAIPRSREKHALAALERQLERSKEGCTTI